MKIHYSIFKNIIYTFKSLKKHSDTSFFYYSCFYVLSSIAVTFFTMALGSFAINQLNKGVRVFTILLNMLLYTLFLLFLNIILNISKLNTDIKANLFRQGVMVDLSEKILSLDYFYLESEEGKTQIERALEAVYAGNDIGLGAIATDSILTVINGLGLLIYSAFAAKLNIFILLILFSSSLFSVYINQRNVKWTSQNKDNWASFDKKIRYLKTQSIELKNAKDIRLYKIQDWFIKLYYLLLNKRMKWYKKEHSRYFTAKVLHRFTTFFSEFIVYGYLIYKATKGMPIDMFILYIGIIAGFSTWVKNLFTSLTRLQSNNLVIDDFRFLMENNEGSKEGQGSPLPKGITHEIEFQNVSFSYEGSEKPIFKNLNLTIRKGEKIALVGMNGAGKTTLIKLLCGLYTPQEGRILLDGIDIRNFDIKDYFKEFSVVFQEVFAFAFTIAENIACCKKDLIDYPRVMDSLREAGLEEKVTSLSKGLHSPLLKDLNEEGIVFSGGELQKLMLARALYKNGKVLVLDEPTAALDPLAESDLYLKYNSFSKDKTSIFISHRLSSTKFCSRILFLKNGEIIEDGTHEELMANHGEYASMYEIQGHYYQKEVMEDVI